MQFDDFLGQVQHCAQLASGEESMRAIHATLETLGERLTKEEADQLAAQLPPEIGGFLQQPVLREKYSLEEFYDRVAMREDARLSAARRHADAVISVLVDAVSPGEIADVRAQLPREFQSLFTGYTA